MNAAAIQPSLTAGRAAFRDAFIPDDEVLGDLLLERELITLAQLDEVRDLARRWRVRILDVLLARDWVPTESLYRTLASYFDLPFVNLLEEWPDAGLLREDDADEDLRNLTIPWRRRSDGRLVVATADPSPATLMYIRSRFGGDVELVVTSKFDIIWTVQRLHDERHSHEAVHALAERDPRMSAKTVLTVPQAVFGYLCVSALLLGLVLAPIGTLFVVNVIAIIFYSGNFAFRAILAWKGSAAEEENARSLAFKARRLREDDLPVFTILVPMFREPDVLPILAHALRSLDYPLAKLDVKIVLEDGDHDTINAARALGLEGMFEIIRVPYSQPQSKPKACNYALRYARGEFLVIYDAEDKPEPDQLRKVIAAFAQAPANTACIQCRLNYYNADENWLTRLFTLDYSLWFDLMLPGLERLGMPIPLGGTSNHFRIDVLRELHGWDPFNVTEDADLGIRLTQKGYRTGVIDSTTYEEANVAIGNWIRQRSRWIKGYMQTLLVHTRRPLDFARTVGPAGVIGFVFFIGAPVISSLLNPIYWAMFVAWLFFHLTGLHPLFPPVIAWLALFNLLAGNGAFVLLSMVAPLRRGWVHLSPWALTVSGYWALMSIAAYKALWQLINNPFYWEKTQHGLSKHTAVELARVQAEKHSAVPSEALG